ncbi:hypothetical protein IL306_011769 [Fusarium sp. DS 682]|nr:hypothetical protein IL306_011769 [Fusarium sp. DS 682]
MSSRVADWTALEGTDAFYRGSQWDTHIQEILLGSSNDASSPERRRVIDDSTWPDPAYSRVKTYPQLYLVIKQRTLVTEEILMIIVDSDMQVWSMDSQLKLSVNTDQIISKCVGNLPRLRGMYVLYKETTDKLSMRFVGLDPEELRILPNFMRDSSTVLHSIDQMVPEGATQIASFDNADGLSDLLIAGNQLSWLSAGDGFQGHKKPISIDESNAYSGCIQLQVSNATNGAMTVRSVTPSATPTSQGFDISSSGAVPTKTSEAVPISGQDKTNDSFAVVVSRAGPRQTITNTFISQSTVDFMFKQLEALAHAPEIAAAREKYIYHFEATLSIYDQLDAKLATYETASQAAENKLTSVHDTLDTHLTNIKIAKTTGNAVAIVGGILCFTPAAFIGAGLVAAGTGTSVGAGALGDVLFEHTASEEFGSIMKIYTWPFDSTGAQCYQALVTQLLQLRPSFCTWCPDRMA